MKNKSIVLHADDAPSVRELTDTISRLKKDYKLLSRIRGSKDIENPDSFRQVIGFLESFLKRGKRKLNKEPQELKPTFHVMMECLVELIEDEPDLANEVMKEINFLERLNATEGSNN